MNSKENIICNSTDPSYLLARCYVGTPIHVMQEEEHGGQSQFRLMTPKWLIRYVGFFLERQVQNAPCPISSIVKTKQSVCSRLVKI